MKVLGLLSSDVRGGDARPARETLFPSRMQAPLAERLGEPVEIEARAIWPTPNLPQVAERWVARSEPDLVVVSIGAFWFLYESMPVRLEKQFGPVGRFAAALLLRAAARPRLAHNGPVQSVRRWLQAHIGGSAHFEPEEVIEVARNLIRALLRHERVYLVVTGPSGGDAWATDERGARRIAERRAAVDTAMEEFCKALHVEYWSVGQLSQMRDPRPSSLQGDRLHMDEEGHRRTAERYLDFSEALLRRARKTLSPEPTIV